jgi:hypothetical protein
MSNPHDHDLHQDQLNAGADRGRPSLGARSRTAYGHRDWAPMRPVIVPLVGHSRQQPRLRERRRRELDRGRSSMAEEAKVIERRAHYLVLARGIM